MITGALPTFAVLWAVIVFSLVLVDRFVWARRLSTILWVLFCCALLSNTGVIPKNAPIYSSIIDFTVPFAVCLILFKVNFADVKAAGRPMLAAFTLASVGTCVSVALAIIVLEPLFVDVLGEDVWKLAGPYVGTYIGGSLNFLALWSGLDIGNQDLFAAANAVDNLALIPLYALWVSAPAYLLKRYAVAKQWLTPEGDGEAVERQAARLDVLHITALVFLAVFVMAVSTWIKTTLVDPVAPSVPGILVVTTLALMVGQLPFVRRLEGAWEMGELVFLVFFAAIGALMDVYLAVVLSPALFLFVLLFIVVDLLFVYGIGWALKMDPRVLTIAQVASKAGPPVVLPVAEALGSRHLVLAGVIVGMVGYGIGNYAGFAVAYFVRFFLVGS